MFRIIRKSLETGIVTGQQPKANTSQGPIDPAAVGKTKPFRDSLPIREVDTGSCNVCEIEMNALANPVYDVERFGVHIVASPRHADALVVTGPFTVNIWSGR
jgi:membrane-bound hydrogenase subunit mbhJ